MDEVLEITEEQFTVALAIPNEDFVYRQVPLTELDKESARFPLPANFTIKYSRGEKELSVSWSAHTSVQQVFEVIGLSANMKGEFKDIKRYKVFSLPVHFLRDVEGIEKVVHSPVFNGNPAPIGSPNIYAHASIFFPESEQVEIRKKLSTYCQQNYGASYCEVDIASLEARVEALKARADNTRYHRCLKNEPPQITVTETVY